MKQIVAVLISGGAAFSRTEVEVLSAASRLAQQAGGSVTAAVLGALDESWDRECAALGAERILRVSLHGYQSDLYAAAARQAATESGADVVLFPSTTYGLEIAPLAGYRLGAAVVLDCTALELAEGALRITKPAYGGKANTELVAKAGPLVLAMRMRSVTPVDKQPGKTATVATLALDPASVPARSRIVQRITEQAGSGPKLEEARVIVSGGRGMGAKENFAHLEQLAAALGGTVGASRAACDLGWVPAGLQIGQTGKKVAPELYVAVGISGASQHLVGVSGARHIVAINTDPKAPIFKAAEVGVVEDWKTFLPKFMEALKRHKAATGGGAAA